MDAKPATPQRPDVALSVLPPSRRQEGLAAAVFAALLVGLSLAIPFADVLLPNSGPFLPAYAAAVLVSDLITAVLLFSIHSPPPARSCRLQPDTFSPARARRPGR